MPILRQISSTFVPSSACLSANGTCSSVNLLFLRTCPWFHRVKNHARFFTSQWLVFWVGVIPWAKRINTLEDYSR